MSTTRLVTVGRVVRPHGLKGELRIESYADSPFLFDELPVLYLQHEGGRPLRCHVQSWRTYKKGLLLFLKEITGLDQAEPWKGASILAKYSDLEMGSSEEIFYQDLIGRTVRLENGHLLGRIARIQNHAGQEVWSIEDDQGREILFPAAEQFILRLEKRGSEVVVDPPQGLLELYGEVDSGRNETA
jgi:16S rRNA processing protein RimM